MTKGGHTYMALVEFGAVTITMAILYVHLEKTVNRLVIFGMWAVSVAYFGGVGV